MKTNRVTLACGGKKCCPEVEFVNDGVVIHDTDDGRDQHVALNAGQVELLRIALNQNKEVNRA